MENILKNKSYQFAIRIVKLSQFLREENKEYVLSGQVLRSGTAIGALIREAAFGQSIALKEASETENWINLLKDTGYIDVRLFESLIADCQDLLRMLISSIKTAKQNNRTER